MGQEGKTEAGYHLHAERSVGTVDIYFTNSAADKRDATFDVFLCGRIVAVSRGDTAWTQGSFEGSDPEDRITELSAAAVRREFHLLCKVA